MSEYKLVHEKRKHKGPKSNYANIQSNHNQQNNDNVSAKLPKDFEAVFEWVPVEGRRISSAANKVIYEEYKEARPQLLKNTVYNEDGSLNEEGMSRLHQAGLSDEVIFSSIAKGRTPNGFNYHHLFPRVLSGSLKDGPIKIGNEEISTIHDWRCLMPLSNAHGMDIHLNVHNAMDERNGSLPGVGGKTTYYIAMPLSKADYELYKENPAAVKKELLIVSAHDYKTVDQREGCKYMTMDQVRAACEEKKEREERDSKIVQFNKPSATAVAIRYKASKSR
ncbi:MAG: hypothetical protein MJ247_00995 [Alphaproteobacteria bacterium]|nr:hypothetical protein [Alphaproteobacteria bacterium]